MNPMPTPIDPFFGNVILLDRPGLYAAQQVHTNAISEANDRIGGVRINERKTEVFSSTYFQHRQYDRYIDVLLRDGNFQTALDVGCGDGRGLDWFLRYDVERSIGLDISLPALHRYAEKGLHPSVSLVHAGILDLDYRAEAFDLILAIESLYYLDTRYEEGLSRLAKALKPGGMLLCSLPDPEACLLYSALTNGFENLHHLAANGQSYEYLDGAPHLIRSYTPAQNDALLEKHGLRPVARYGLSALPLLLLHLYYQNQPDNEAHRQDLIETLEALSSRDTSFNRLYLTAYRKA